MKVSPQTQPQPQKSFIQRRVDQSVEFLSRTSVPQKLTNAKSISKTTGWLLKPKAGMWFGIISLAMKDFVGMLAYYYQSINNEKIPVEKRKYVASYELMSGAINCTLPFILGLTIQNDKVQDEIAYRLFKKYYVDKKTLSEATGKTKELLKEREVIFNTCRKSLGKFSALVLAAIISKRLIVPFFSGPLASKWKQKYMSSVADEKTEKIEKHIGHRPQQQVMATNQPVTPNLKKSLFA